MRPPASLAVAGTATGSRCSWGLAIGSAAFVFPSQLALPEPALPPSPGGSCSGVFQRRNGRFFEPVDLQGEVSHQPLQVMVLPFQGLNLLAGSVSDGVSGETLLASFHELFGPGIEGPGSNALPSAEVTDGYLPPEPLQDDVDLLFWGVLSARCGSDLSDEGPGFLGAGLSPLLLVYVTLGHFGSFHDAHTLYPPLGALATFPLSGF